jgi:hypothetical protein
LFSIKKIQALFLALITYLLTYGAEPFLRSCQLCSHSGLFLAYSPYYVLLDFIILITFGEELICCNSSKTADRCHISKDLLVTYRPTYCFFLTLGGQKYKSRLTRSPFCLSFCVAPLTLTHNFCQEAYEVTLLCVCVSHFKFCLEAYEITLLCSRYYCSSFLCGPCSIKGKQAFISAQNFLFY